MKRCMSLLLAFLLLLTPVTSAYAQETEMEVTRISGANRYETAVKISQASFKESPVAIVASGENFPDALVGGTLAVQLDAPILTVQKNAAPQIVIDEINRLDVETIYLLGGANTITPAVENELAKHVTDVVRIAGTDRFETSWAIAGVRQHLHQQQTGTQIGGDLVSYASGSIFADALAAAPFVGQIIEGIEPDVIIESLILAKPDANIDGFRVFGGENAVPSQTKLRVAGSNRYATAVEIAKLYPKELGTDIEYVVLADGTNYPDALAAASMMSGGKHALLLTSPKMLSTETRNYLKDNGIKNVIIVGGENSVSKAVFEQVENLYKPVSVDPLPVVPKPVDPTPVDPTLVDPKPGTTEPAPRDPKDEDLAYLYADGRIIGNKNSLIYHMPNQVDYKKVKYKNAVYFDTEAEAKDAGYRKALR